jgi:hypothetical protein
MTLFSLRLLLRFDSTARKRSISANYRDFVQAVFNNGVFLIFPVPSGQIPILSGGKRPENSAIFRPGILLPCFVCFFRPFSSENTQEPAGNDWKKNQVGG